MQHFRPSWVPEEGAGVQSLFNLVDRAVPAFFAPDRPIVIGRAPGRLDVMGGIADVSGALVLQLPLAEAVCSAAQQRDDDQVHVWSPCKDHSRSSHVAIRLGDLGLPDQPIDYARARAVFRSAPRDSWSFYVLGMLLALAREHGVRFDRGFAILLASDVPEVMGVGASAAMEIAALRAIAELHGIKLHEREIALLCQKVENEVAGAPGGVMDQMTALCGTANHLLALRCQPAEIEGQVPVPHSIEIFGMASGLRHEPEAAEYRRVRSAAFMGYRVLAEARGLVARGADGSCTIDDPQWHGFLANCTREELHARWLGSLPETMKGSEFLARHGGTTDPFTVVEPDVDYPVRAATLHTIEENARAERFRTLLGEPMSPDVLCELGDLMLASHDAYSACGLGSPGTDLIVQEVRNRRAHGSGIWGARVTARGNGGTVAILGERGRAYLEVLRIKKAVSAKLPFAPEIFRWSSDGALTFGTVALTPTQPS